MNPRVLEPLAWLVPALVHTPPALALVAPSLLTRLYGVDGDATVILLLQHRAGLFLMVVVACVWSAVDPAPRRLAAVLVAISMVSFLILYWTAGTPETLRVVAVSDLVALPALAYVSWRAFGAG
jgi:hypothetical protein